MSESREEFPRSKKQPPYVTGPTPIISPEMFAKWMPFAVSPEILNEERLALLKRMSDDLAEDPAFLKKLERMLEKYGDEIYRISPNDADLRRGGFGWLGGEGEPEGPAALPPPAAAAAALAPPAASLAAAHAPGE